MVDTKESLGTGRRKTAVARVRMADGSGKIVVNGRALEDYFTVEVMRTAVERPLRLTDQLDGLDIRVSVRGGGLSGQAGAIRHGISRALLQYNPELRGVLKADGLLTRDPRKKERKKYGQPGARKRFQYSKR